MIVPVEVSARHVHLSEADFRALFGHGELHVLRELSQPGQFAARECVTLLHDGKTLKDVRLVGPFRGETQVELAPTDARALGYEHLPLKDKHESTGGASITVVGPKSSLRRHGAFYSKRHLHCDPQSAKDLGRVDGDEVRVRIQGARGLILEHVIVRVRGDYRLRLHLDTDEGNAAGLKGGEHAVVVQ